MRDFAVNRAEVREGVELAYWRLGEGGAPLLLLHGWPETKRIWARNVEPLAKAGFDVIVPDLRGFGDSGLAPDGFYDLAAFARDVEALVRGLGHEWCAACGGDVGGAVIQDLGLRFEGFVRRQVLFNTVVPVLEDGSAEITPVTRAAADYFLRQGTDADALAAELATSDMRRRYVEQFYGPRFWASPGAFAGEEAAWHAQPFEDADHLRASFGVYESACGRPMSEVPRFAERNPVETLVLYGPDDHVIRSDFPELCEIVFERLVGPFVVPRAGHFLQWERADLLNATLTAFLRDMRG